MLEQSSEGILSTTTKLIEPPVVVKPIVQQPENLKAMQEQIKQMVTGTGGGATAAGAERTQAQIMFLELLKSKINLTPAQFGTLPEDLRNQIDNFDPKNNEELDRGVQTVLARLKEIPQLNDEQKTTLDSLHKAVYEDKTLKIEDVFKELAGAVQDLPAEDQTEAKEAVEEMQRSDKPPQEKAKSVIERMPKLVKWFGLGGVAALLFALWRGLKEMMSGGAAGGQSMGFPTVA